MAYKIVVLTGAGISAESGIKTFRDADGLWEGHDIHEVASPQAFKKNPELVLDFYNQRRRQLKEVEPNRAHYLLAQLQNEFTVQIITQNVDDLHERAGSSNVLHLHGQLRQVRPINNEQNIIDWTEDLKMGDVDAGGNQLRPHIVWFGESVPMMERAIEQTREADLFLIIGTSLQVYPAAGLIDYVPQGKPIILIDPKAHLISENRKNIIKLNKLATTGMQEFIDSVLPSLSL